MTAETFAELWESLEPNGYHVYRLYGKEDQLLCIGMTSALKARIRQHHEEKPWAKEIARLEHEGGYAKAEASRRELFTYVPRLRALQMPLGQVQAVLCAYGREDLAEKLSKKVGEAC